MKRSEVLEKLADLLEFLRQDLDNGSDYQDAETVLYFLEKEVGMLPKKRTITVHYDAFGVENCGKYNTEEYSWEPDEKK